MIASDEPLTISIAPRVRKSPYYEATRRWGCTAYTVYNHMLMPLYYEDPVSDYWRLVNDVTLWDVAAERQVEISGPDATRFVQYLSPRNLSTLQVGQARYVLLTNAEGGIVNDPVLLKLAEDRYWLSLADSDVLLWAQGVAVHAGMDVRIDEPDVSPLQLQGPHSVDVLRDLFGEELAALRYFRFVETELDGIPLVVSRTGWSSERGYELFLRDGGRGEELWERVMEAGRPWRIAPAAPSQIRRIEGGMLSYGSDMTLRENPFELNLGRLVNLDQETDFVGRNALEAISRSGVRRRMVGLELAGAPIASNEHWWPVRTPGGQAAGKVTSAVYSPRLSRNLALALVAVEHASDGSELVVDTPEGAVTATVAPYPFFDPAKRIAAAS